MKKKLKKFKCNILRKAPFRENKETEFLGWVLRHIARFIDIEFIFDTLKLIFSTHHSIHTDF
jgi:hypothetical protein